jgi:hypothetical protein
MRPERSDSYVSERSILIGDTARTPCAQRRCLYGPTVSLALWACSLSASPFVISQTAMAM